jgi:hypothetical protein
LPKGVKEADYVKPKVEDTSDYLHKQTSHFRNEGSELVDRGKAALDGGRAGVESVLEAGAKFYRQLKLGQKCGRYPLNFPQVCHIQIDFRGTEMLVRKKGLLPLYISQT